MSVWDIDVTLEASSNRFKETGVFCNFLSSTKKTILL